MEKTSDQMYGDLLLLLGNPTVVEPEVLVGYLRDVERMHSLGRITSWQLDRARRAYEATVERDPNQGAPRASSYVVGDLHPDPITGSPGAHPLGTGVGAMAGGAAAGAAIGSIAGPVGAFVGVAIGAVVGGLAGKGVAEMIDPTAEEVYWRANYASRPYVAAGATYDDYGPAFSHGIDAYREHPGKSFEEIESALARDWPLVRSGSTLDWESARDASRDAWSRADSSALSDAHERSRPKSAERTR